MDRRSTQLAIFGAAVVSAGAFILAAGCSASNKGGSTFDEGGGGTTASSGTGGCGNSSQVGGNTGIGGDGGFIATTGGTGGTGGMIVDPCASECGPDELCDGSNAGLDNDCDGTVDEGCSCSAGMVQSCFKGEPAYKDEPGCFPGQQHCNELGMWGECNGGVHATDGCYQSTTGCHAISTLPFVPVNLKDGTGSFSSDAQTESWTVDCPAGVNPCPAVSGTNPQDDFTPLQSGEYTVTYFKTTASGDDQCTYPLFVGAPGLRVELEWEHDLGGDGVDLDLHLHKPADTTPWQGSSGNPVDCAYDNCTAMAFNPMFPNPFAPNWFNGVAPPDPVNWYLDPVFEKNTCYFGPAGSGAAWQAMAAGCHNPRLDSDNIFCDPTVTDPANGDFCRPENINIDFPPTDQWTRIGVHYYSDHGLTYDVHPTIKIFCHGALAAELGPSGFYTPTAPVTFTPADGSTLFWLVADVKFIADECDDTMCEVAPIYLDAALQTPLLTTVSMVQQSYGPPYPP